MEVDPAPSEHLGPAGEAEWTRLRRHLELAQGFWLGFVFTPSPPAAAVLRERAELHLHSRRRTLALLRPGDPDGLRTVWHELHTVGSRQAGCVWVEAVRADPSTQPRGPWTSAWEALLLALNEQREILRRDLSGGLVLVTLPELEPRARELASDLWSIRSLVVDLPAVASEGVGVLLDIPQESLLADFGIDYRGMPLTPAAGLRDLRDRLREVERLLVLDDTEAAVEVARDAVALAQRVPEARPGDVAVALAWLSRAEERHGALAAAAAHVEDALRVADETVDQSTVRELLDRAGRLAERRGDLRRARPPSGRRSRWRGGGWRPKGRPLRRCASWPRLWERSAASSSTRGTTRTWPPRSRRRCRYGDGWPSDRPTTLRRCACSLRAFSRLRATAPRPKISRRLLRSTRKAFPCYDTWPN